MGLLRYDGNKFQRITPETQGESTRFFPVHSDAEHTVWVGGDHNQLWRVIDGELHPQPLDLSGTKNIRKIQGDRQGRIWLCTLGNGAYCLDGDQLQHFTRDDGLAFDVVNGMLEDREGLLWFATWGGGLSSYDPYSIQSYPQNHAISPRRPSSQTPMGYKFSDDLQTRAFAIYDDQLIDVPAAVSDAAQCYALHEDTQRQLWLGTENGLYQYQNDIFVSVGTESGLAGAPLHAIRQTRSGGLLLGQYGPNQQLQLMHWDGKTVEILHTLEQTSPRHQYISAIRETAHGDIWFGANMFADHGLCHGLYRLDDSIQQHYTLADGLPDNRIADLLEDGAGGLWIATLGGLSRFDGREFATFTTEQGLPNNHIRCLHIDAKGQLWMGSESGVIRYRDGYFQPVLPQHIGATRKIVSAPNGSLWFGTEQSLINYTPQATPPRVRIEQLVADQTYTDSTTERIITTAQQITIEYRGICQRSLPQHLLYAHKLLGIDSDWQPLTRQRQAIYRNLLPGDYTFQVRALYCNFNESTPAEIHFSVQPDPLVQGLHQALNQSGHNSQFTGHSTALQWVNSQLATVATTDLSVLILGAGPERDWPHAPCTPSANARGPLYRSTAGPYQWA